MHRERLPGRPPDGQRATAARDVQHPCSPGKRTLTDAVVQRREAAPGSEPATSGTTASPPGPLASWAGGGPRVNLQMLFGAQGLATPATAVPAGDPAQVHAAATRGIATAPSRLPFADQIQRAFGPHDISGIQAHVGGDAAASARTMGARAYATGDHVVLGEGADLHTVAHEAAHVVQQRGGVQLKGGVGQVGDAYEHHADAVADRVVAGASAADLLGTADATPSASVQRKPIPGNNTNMGQEYTDDRGGPTMREVSGSPGWYTVGESFIYHYPDTDQYSPDGQAWWDPITGKTFTIINQWYVNDGATYYYDGARYVAYPQEGNGGIQQNDQEEARNDQRERQDEEMPIDLDAINVPVFDEKELRSWGIKDVGMAIMIIESQVSGQEWEKAWSLLKGWNEHHEKFKIEDKEEQSKKEEVKKNQPKKRTRKEAQPPRRIDPKECGLELKHIEYLEKDKQREEKSSLTKKRKKELDKLVVEGKEYALAPLSTDGGFYDVYHIIDEAPILPRISNSELVLRIPKTGPDRELARKGMLERSQISDHVEVPKVGNQPGQDGFFLVEKIAFGCDPKPWREAGSFNALSEVERKRLTSIRQILVQNARSGRQVVPDFRPSNLRFRTEDSPMVVLVDFTDEAGLMGEHGPKEFAREMKHILREFCGMQKNWLYDYLTEGMPEDLVLLIDQVELF